MKRKKIFIVAIFSILFSSCVLFNLKKNNKQSEYLYNNYNEYNWSFEDFNLQIDSVVNGVHKFKGKVTSNYFNWNVIILEKGRVLACYLPTIDSSTMNHEILFLRGSDNYDTIYTRQNDDLVEKYKLSHLILIKNKKL